MKAVLDALTTQRYKTVTQEKSGGATFTPKILADFVAQQMLQSVGEFPANSVIRVLDPAVGHGELLISLLDHFANQPKLKFEIYGFETDPESIEIAESRIKAQFPTVSIQFKSESFLDFVLENFGFGATGTLFHQAVPESYDLIIANPPYVRTQIMGAERAQLLTRQFGLSGRVDLYYAFVLAMSQVLKPKGVAGIIVSNRFMTTRSGASVRQALLERFNLRHAWDLGDTKLFDAAVLPAVLLVGGKNGHKLETPYFTSIYNTKEPSQNHARDPIHALTHNEAVVQVDDGRRFEVQHGKLNTSGAPDGVWRISSDSVDSWIATVEAHTWGVFRDIGKIRVGVKTCADKIFIRNDWQELPENEQPELLRPLTTHHIARRFKAEDFERPAYILYPHEVAQGRRRPVDIVRYPRSKTYLERHRSRLEGRSYVIEAGRNWYEIWVPQDPEAWDQPKLVFRDISKEPTFWMDQTGSIVNGDCYWLACQNPAQTDLLWLALAVANSSFIERFYDHHFHNKLYAGRRRFITQYVEKFPLPDPQSALAKEIIANTKIIYKCIPSPRANQLQKEVDSMVWRTFGLIFEEISG